MIYMFSLRIYGLLIFLLISNLLFSQQDVETKNKRDAHLTLTHKYKIDDGKINKIRIIILIPNDVKDRQTVNSFGFNINPDSLIYDQGNAYAVFYLYNMDKNFEVILNADLTLYKHISKINNDSITDFNPYLKAEEFIEVNSPEIKKIADTLKKENELETIISTYNFVKNHITYKKKQTIGAEEVLETAEGKCADFSDLFVALLRANKIPAKTVKGMTTDAINNIFHQWAEVYIKNQGWVLFDPTTEHTSIYRDGNSYKIREKNKYIILSQKGYDSLLQKAAHSFAYSSWNCTHGTIVKRKTKFDITVKE